MAIALGLNPGYATGGSGPITTLAFSPAAGSLIIVTSHVDSPAALSPVISDTVGLTWTAIGTVQVGSSGGQVMAWWAHTATARTGMTATVDWSSTGSKCVKVTTFTGTAAASAVVTKAQNVSSTNNLTVNVTNTNDGCRIMGAATDWQQRGLPTSTDDEVGVDQPGAISSLTVWKAANTSGTGVSVSLNFDGAGASTTAWAYKIWEIVPGAGGGPVDITTDAAVQAQVADAPALTQLHGPITVADATEAQTADSPALTQIHALTVADALEAQTADSPALTQFQGTLTVADAVQALTSDSVTVAAGGALTVDDVQQPQVADTPTLTQLHVLTVADATEAQTADAVTLTQVHDLTVAAAIQQQTADTVTFVGALVVNDATQQQTADSPALTQFQGTLTVADAVQPQTAASLVLVDPGTTLTINEPVQSQVAGSPSLTQLHTLAVDAAIEVLTSDVVALTQLQGTLTVADAVQPQTSEVPSLTQVSLVGGSMNFTPRIGPSMAGVATRTTATMTATSRRGPTMTGE